MKYSFIILLLSTLTLAGCATNSGSTYSSAQTQRIQTLQQGTVVGVEYVTIKADSSVIGSLGGAAIGGIAGSTVGGGKGSSIAAIIGAIAGSYAGSATENAANAKNGVRITLRLDNQRTISIVQPMQSNHAFATGDRVQLITTQGSARVAHAP